MTAARVSSTRRRLTSVAFSPRPSRSRFRNGLIYEYLGVSSGLCAQLLVAPSKGAFFVRFIRDRFPHRRI